MAGWRVHSEIVQHQCCRGWSSAKATMGHAPEQGLMQMWPACWFQFGRCWGHRDASGLFPSPVPGLLGTYGKALNDFQNSTLGGIIAVMQSPISSLPLIFLWPWC
jgi:hypothetical protein